MPGDGTMREARPEPSRRSRPRAIRTRENKSPAEGTALHALLKEPELVTEATAAEPGGDPTRLFREFDLHRRTLATCHGTAGRFAGPRYRSSGFAIIGQQVALRRPR